MATDIDRAFHMRDPGFAMDHESDSEGEGDFGLIPAGAAANLNNARAPAGDAPGARATARFLPFQPGQHLSQQSTSVHDVNHVIPLDLVPVGPGFLVLDRDTLRPVPLVDPRAPFAGANERATVCLVSGQNPPSVTPQRGTFQVRVRRDALDTFLGGRQMPIRVDLVNLNDTADVGRFNGGVYGDGHTRAAFALTLAGGANRNRTVVISGIQGGQDTHVQLNVQTD